MPNDVITPNLDKMSVEDLADELGKVDSTDDKVEEEIVIGREEPVLSDEDKEDNKEVVSKRDEKENDEDEEKELKLEDEEDEELKYQDVPRRKVIEKEFPGIFKKFPSLQRVLYREQQYSEIFVTPAEAKEALEHASNFKKLAETVNNGSITEILSEVKTSNPEAFGKITKGLLKTLATVDQESYLNVVNHIIINTLSSAIQVGKKTGNDEGKQLEIAGRLLSKFIYGVTDVPTDNTGIGFDRKPEGEENSKESELKKREEQFAERQLTTAIQDVNSRAERTVLSAVEKYIDPKGSMSEYVKEKAVHDALAYITQGMKEDGRFNNLLSKHWEQAVKEGFSEESKKRIRQTLISKAQDLLPDVIKRVRAAALKGSASPQNGDRAIREVKDEKPVSGGRPASTARRESPLREVPRNMSTLDFLNQD
jgi:hypothetical protein